MGYEYKTERVFSESFLEVVRIELEGIRLYGVKFDIAKAPLIVLKEESGRLVVGCGYISIETMEKLETPSCVVTGVKSFEDVLNSEIRQLTSKAKKMGLREGMRVIDALNLLR